MDLLMLNLEELFFISIEILLFIVIANILYFFLDWLLILFVIFHSNFTSICDRRIQGRVIV